MSLDQPSGPPVSLQLEDVERTELGTLIGAFRDVAYSIDMQVMAVSLRVRRAGEEMGSEEGMNDAARGQLFPKGRGRKELKLVALVQTFADTVLDEGYVVEAIDMKPAVEVQTGRGKQWEIRVELRQA